MLGECSSFSLQPTPCESAADALREAAALRPALLFTSPAVGDADLLAQVKGVRVCWLCEGAGPEAPEGAEVLRAERLTPQLIDAWVRRPGRPSGAGRTPLVPPPRPVPRPPKPPAGSSEPGPAPAAPARPPVPPAAQRPPAPAPVPRASAAPSSQRPPAQRPAAPHAASRPAAPPGPVRARPQAPVPRPVVSVIRQQVIAFWGGKPGAGRSTLAVALADLLARAGELRVCLVDLNPYNSSLAPLLGREQEVSSWLQLSEALAKGSPFPLDALRWVRPNLALVSGPDGRAEWLSQLTPEAIAWVVQGLRTQFDYIILDPEARPGSVSETAARLAQLVLVTVSPDYPDVLDTARAFEAGLEAGWLDRGRCRLLLSRWVDSPHLAMAEVGDCFNLPVSLSVPLSAEAVLQASGQGIPVTQVTARGAEALQHPLGQLVGLVAPPVATAVSAGARASFSSQLRGWFGR